MRAHSGARVLCAFVFGCLGFTVAAADSGSAADVAMSHVAASTGDFGITEADIGEMAVSSTVVSAHNGVTHVYLQQRYRGIDVWNAIINVNVGSDGGVLSADSGFYPNIAAAAGQRTPRTTSAEAVQAATRHLDLALLRPVELRQNLGGADERATFSDGGIAAKAIDAKLVWLPQADAVHLAWVVEIEQSDGEHWWYAFVDAETGESLGKQDLIIHDSIPATAGAIARPHGAPQSVVSFPATDGATYRVFPIPLESPTDGDRQLVSNAADPAASPFGWHDTDGAAGAEFTVTRGNNVHAYADRDNNNIPDPGSDPDGGAGLVFDFPLDFTRRPFDSQPAIVTNLFYWNNIVHDVTYNYGFNEASGNFQVNNYGKGGLGGDDVRAEAQDGSGRNNANFGTGVEGLRPRMQMFEWRSATPNPVTVHAPSPIAGTYFGPMAGFGESLVTTGPLSGTVVLVNDGVAPTSDGCQAFAVPAGSIPLIDRGGCNFTVKVKNAQNAGAAVAIVANNVAGAPFGMGGADPTITIPSVMISLDDGNLFKANLPLDATIADGTGGVPDRDSDLDAGVIAHEYGHGISNRLTGGPAVVTCLNNAEQMGEGWSDWFGIALTTHPSDRPSTRRGVGTYVIFQPADGNGIRPTPYSTNMAVNPATYAAVADVVNISQPHGIGYVWNTMLWEVYWNLIDRHGYNANVYGPWSSGGNNLALQLVMDGMKFQPCRPGFQDGRDAIILADVALTGGANHCEIWRGFAKRGMGASASQGSSASRTDGVEAFDLPASCTAATVDGFFHGIAAPPAVNSRKRAASISVGFTIHGDDSAIQLDSQNVDCSTLEITGERPRVIPLHGPWVRHHETARYRVDWHTDYDWKGTCRKLTLRVPAVQDKVAYFSFR